MSLLPIFSPVGLEVLGASVMTTSTQFPDFDFTSLNFEAGDLLIAIVGGENRSDASPSGFTLLGGANDIEVWTKTADGTETTVSNGGGRTAVATVAVRGGAAGLFAGADKTINPPSIANSAGDIVFAVATTQDNDKPTTTLTPGGYTDVGEYQNSAGDTWINVAYRANALANENPGIMGDPDNDGTYTSAVTFSTTPT